MNTHITLLLLVSALFTATWSQDCRHAEAVQVAKVPVIQRPAIALMINRPQTSIVQRRARSQKPLVHRTRVPMQHSRMAHRSTPHRSHQRWRQ